MERLLILQVGALTTWWRLHERARDLLDDDAGQDNALEKMLILLGVLVAVGAVMGFIFIKIGDARDSSDDLPITVPTLPPAGG